MNTLSFTQEFFACTVNEKGKVPFLRQTEVLIGLVVGGISELTSEGYVQADEKEKYMPIKPLDSEKSYLQPLYDFISKKPMKVTTIAENYLSSTKLFVQFFNAIGESLANAEYAEKAVNQSFFGKKVTFIPTPDCADMIVEKIRAELLGKGTVSDDIIVLCSLLDKCGVIKNYFSKVESNKLKIRLEEIRKSDAHKTIRKVLDSLDTSYAAVAVFCS